MPNRGVAERIAKVREPHPCEVPEAVALPVVGGPEDHLAWLGEGTRSGALRERGAALSPWAPCLHGARQRARP